MPDSPTFVDEADGFGGAHEAKTPVGRDHADHVEHLRGEVGDGTVFDEEGDFAGVVGWG